MVKNTVLPPSSVVKAGSGPKPLVFSEETKVVTPVGPKPVAFPDPPKKDEPVVTVLKSRPPPGPGSLTFPDRPVNPFPQSRSEDLKIVSAEHKAKAIQFKDPPVKPKPVATPGKSLFGSDDNESVIKAAIEYVKSHYGELGASHERIERQIRQLYPLKLDVLMSWGAAALTDNGTYATQSATAVKAITELNSTELIDAALKSANGVPTKTGFFQKVLNNRPVDILQYKPRLIVLQTVLRQALPNFDSLIEKSSATEVRLLLNVAALAAMCEVLGTQNDQTLERASYDRRTVLAQGANQAKLVGLQLTQTRALIVDQLVRLEQMLNVTIPAFEMANATR